MKYLVFEDEELVANMLIKLIKQCKPNYELIDVLPSVEAGVNRFLSDQPLPDVIFMDIQLSDGPCFELFGQVNIEIPIIFTTAYDQYAIQAFKLNSVDYLVKPIDVNDLKSAIDKFEKFSQPVSSFSNQRMYEKVMQYMLKSYKQRFMVKIGAQLKYINAEDIACFMFSDRMVYACLYNGKNYILDYTLEQLEKLVDPHQFFRINRKFILNINSIQKIHTFFNQRLKLEINPQTEEDVIVSRDRVAGFKTWLDR